MSGCEVEIKDDFNSLGTTLIGDLGCLFFETPEKLVIIRNMPSYAIIPSSNPDSPLPPNIQELMGVNRNIEANDLIDDDVDLKVKEIHEIGKKNISYLRW